MGLLGKIGGILGGAAKGALGSLGGGVSKGGILGGAVSGAIGAMGGRKTPAGSKPVLSSGDVGISQRPIMDDPERGGITGRLPRKKAFSKGFTVASRSMSGDR